MSSPSDDTPIMIAESPPMTAMPTDSYIFKRIPSLNNVSSRGMDAADAADAADAEAAEGENRVPLMNHVKEKQERGQYNHPTCVKTVIGCVKKYEKRLLPITIKLLFHIQLISMFETVFFFFYVSSLEDGGIEHTIDAFINGAIEQCHNMTASDISIINSYIGPYVNRTEIDADGTTNQAERAEWNQGIMVQSWVYMVILSGIFLSFVLYSRIRRIEIDWKTISIENLCMVGLLSGYEIIFFNTIIFHYQPISSSEIRKNAIDEFHDTCGLF